ncbi:MAG: YfbM family protein [Candidatus Sulfotelmatobacter sp.]
MPLTTKKTNIPAHMRQAMESQFRARAGMTMKPGAHPATPQEPEADKKECSLNKDWHVLHYALNGTAEGGDAPLGFVVFGDKEFPEMEDVDYGPARYLSPEQVRQVSAALQNIEPKSLLSKLNYEDAKKKRIYLDHTLNDLGNWTYLPELFIELRKFYSDAAEHGNGMIMKIL